MDDDIHVSDLLHPHRGFERILHGELWVPKKPIQSRVLIGEGGHRVFRSNGDVDLDKGIYTGYDYDVPVRCDNVVGHIDLVENVYSANQAPGEEESLLESIPGELKITWYSPDKPINQLGTYFDQLGAYCHMMGVTHGRLFVCYLMDYKWRKDVDGDGISPIFDSWDVYFEQEDLGWFWDVLLERKDLIEDLRIVKNPFDERRDLDGWLVANTEVHLVN